MLEVFSGSSTVPFLTPSEFSSNILTSSNSPLESLLRIKAFIFEVPISKPTTKLSFDIKIIY